MNVTQKYLHISYQNIALFVLGMVTVSLVFWLAGIAGAEPTIMNLAATAPPQVVSFQGTVEIDSALYSGTGFFKFAIMDSSTGDGTMNYWSNDGTASGVPSQAVPLTVGNGLFEIMLGDTSISGMTTTIADTVFENSDTYLRVWFSQELNGPFEALEPNQRIGSVPYALRASYAETGSAMVPAGAVMFFDDTSCPMGWTELTAARGRAVVGLPSGGTLNGILGTALANLENRSHSHSVDPATFNTGNGGSHNHTTGEPTHKGGVGLTTGSFLIFYGEDDHLHNISTGGSHNHSVNVPNTTSSNASTDDVIPYIQLLTCKKD